MTLHPGIIRTTALDVEAIRTQAHQEGYVTFALPASGIIDRESFFNTIRATLPLDPPLVSSRSWDALSDSLWEGLRSISNRRIAILWPNARVMTYTASADFELALNVLEDVATSLSDPVLTSGNPKEVAVVVEIAGASRGS